MNKSLSSLSLSERSCRDRRVRLCYEDLVGHARSLQVQTAEMEKIIDERCRNQRKIPEELISRSLIFIDLYGNRLANEYLDHQLIRKVLKKCRKELIPKYLHSWIQIGVRQGEKIEVLQIDQLQSTVADYPAGQEFITFGEVTVRIGTVEHPALGKLKLKLFLMDRMEKVREEIRKHRTFQTIELRLCRVDPSITPTRTAWNEGKTLNSTETILSARLFEETFHHHGSARFHQLAVNACFCPLVHRSLDCFQESIVCST